MTPVTNMYMWQPVAGAAYPPCVDGDFDMTVIGHEYTHAISNRMIAGPDSGISSLAGRGDGRELVRPAGHGVPVRERATPRAATRRT